MTLSGNFDVKSALRRLSFVIVIVIVLSIIVVRIAISSIFRVVVVVAAVVVTVAASAPLLFSSIDSTVDTRIPRLVRSASRKRRETIVMC